MYDTTSSPHTCAVWQRSLGWETITNLVVIRNKIENVRITLRRAIVVLVHAHVTLDQALSAVDAEQIVGVVTLPCCNWFSQHEALFARPPDVVYDDFSVLSDKREVRVWVGEQAPASAVVIPDAEAKVCVRKVFHAESPASSDSVAGIQDTDDTSAPVAAAHAKCARVLGIFSDLLTNGHQSLGTDEAESRVRELPAELLQRLPKTQHILILDSIASRVVAARLLCQGYEHVYVLSAPLDTGATSSTSAAAMSVSLLKLTLAHSSSSSDATNDAIVETNQGSLHLLIDRAAIAAMDLDTDDDDAVLANSVLVTFQSDASASPFSGIDCVVDHRFIYHGFRGESRNAPLFRQLCALVHRVARATTANASSSKAATFVCVTPRKNWRKKEYLSHESLQFDVQSVAIKQAQRVVSWALEHRAQRDQELTFAFVCVPVDRGDADRVFAAQELASHQQLKDAVLAMKRTLQIDLHAVRTALVAAGTHVLDLSVPAALALAPQAAEIDPSVVANRTYVQVLGQITNVRRYSKGMAFVTLAPVRAGPVATSSSSFETAASGPETTSDASLQAFLQLDELAWPPTRFYDVLQMLHPGDDVCVLGFCKKSERGTPLLAVAAIEFVRGEFAAYE